MDTTGTHLSERKRQIFLRALTSTLPFFSMAFSLGCVFLYFLFNYWQFLATAAVSALLALFSGLAYFTYRRGKINITMVILFVSSCLLFPSFTLFWSGAGIIFVLILGNWLTIGALIYYSLLQKTGKVIASLGGVLATILIITFGYYHPLSRVDVTEFLVLRWLIPLIVIVGGSFFLVMVTRMPLGKRLYTRTLIPFVLVVLIPIITVSTITTISSLENDRQNAVRTLENIALQKSDAINLWVANIQTDLNSIPHDELIEQNILFFFNNHESNLPNDAERQFLIERFNQILAQTNRLKEIFLVDPDGNVILATYPYRLYREYDDQDFFIEGKTGFYISQPFYLQDTGEMSILVSRPILNTRGETVGILAGRADMREITDIILARTGLGKTEKTLLINDTFDLLNGIIVSQSSKQIMTDASMAVVSTRNNDSMLYKDENGIDVIGAYRWIPSLQVAVISEINQDEAFENARTVLQTNILIALLSAGLAVLGAVITARTISSPIGILADAANQIASGNLQTKVVLDQEDELGTLGDTLNNMTTQLRELVTNLEQRVADRTRNLERRTNEIKTAAQVARDTSLSQNVDDLLTRSSRLIKDRFGFYHVGFFLIDEKREYAVLSAAAGEAGQLMLANQHKLRIGDVGIVGYVAAAGQPRVALDTGADAVYFRNPLLPYTHSELSLPLKIGDNVIGVLDVQSEKINAFDQEDIDTLQVMADQIAVAIERTRLVQELRQVVAHMETTSKEYSNRSWVEFIQQSKENQGYRFQGVKAEPITNPPPESDDAFAAGKIVIQNDPGKRKGTLAVPIKLRGTTIGVLNLRFIETEIPAQTVTMVEEAAERLALALENVRLIQDAQRLATREQQVNIITSRMQSSTDLEVVLQNAIRELGNTLGIPKTFIQIGLRSHDGTNFDENTSDQKRHN